MKTRFFMIALLGLCATNVHSQQPGDTITVSSFHYGQTGHGFGTGVRDSVINFPDDSNLEFEKVIISYNMRCKGGNVNTGGGNHIACGEWDYSCNTFIHDSTRADSLINTHPDYTISGWSGTTYDYTTQPTYDYFQHTQQSVTINNTINEVLSGFGATNLTMDDVMSVQYESGKSQYLIPASELQASAISAGEIDAIALDVLSGISDVQFLRIRMKNTTATTLDPAAVDLLGFTEAYFLDYTTILGPQRFDFSTPFNWDGTSNVIIEINFTAGSTQSNIQFEGDVATPNTAIVSNKTDRYAELAGSGQYIDAPDGTYDFTGGFTYTGWIYYDGHSNWSRIMDFGNGPNNNNIILANQGTSNDLHFSIRNSAGNGSFSAVGVLPLNEWVHVAATMDPSGNAVIYINGVQVETGTVNVPDVLERPHNYLGRSNWSNDAYFDGKMDDIAIWTTALTQTEIQDWMHQDITASHPQYANLLMYYNFNDANLSQATDGSSNGNSANLENYIPSLLFDGRDIFKNIDYSANRPYFILVQGDHDITVNDVLVLDSLQLAPNVVTEYEVASNAGTVFDDDINILSTNNYFEAVDQNVYDAETGTLLSSIPVSAEGSISPADMNYWRRWPMKFEIMSFVTPYGIGLNLGPEGKTWLFDMTDFLPILKGSKRMTIEGAGAHQEDMDIKFHFIVGTPPRDVVDIQSIWRTRSAGYTSILDDSSFPPRDVVMDPNADAFKIRTAITGHGQQGEFISRLHWVDVDGGVKENEWAVWSECAENPIYPQGGTWIYDRAGWCPGAPTDLQELDITDVVTPGQIHTFDYGMNNASGTSNYIVNNQLVSYGSPNHTLDASITDIMNPSNYVEYYRTNGICATPTVELQNTGSTALTEATIEYWVNSSAAPQTFNWTGSLEFLEKAIVELPTGASLWDDLSGTGTNTFHARVVDPNGGTDEYAFNDAYATDFEVPEVVPNHFYIYFRTNSAAFESSYELLDDAGTVLFSRSGMSNNTTYRDTFELGYGCYKLHIKDSGDDGIDFWANNDGVGQAQIRQVGGGIVKQFDGDFGDSRIHNFTIDYPLSYEELFDTYVVELYPNPAKDQFVLEAGSIAEADIEVLNNLGQKVDAEMQRNGDQVTVITEGLPTGIYLVKMNYRGKLISKKVIIE